MEDDGLTLIGFDYQSPIQEVSQTATPKTASKGFDVAAKRTSAARVRVGSLLQHGGDANDFSRSNVTYLQSGITYDRLLDSGVALPLDRAFADVLKHVDNRFTDLSSAQLKAAELFSAIGLKRAVESDGRRDAAHDGAQLRFEADTWRLLRDLSGDRRRAALAMLGDAPYQSVTDYGDVPALGTNVDPALRDQHAAAQSPLVRVELAAAEERDLREARIVLRWLCEGAPPGVDYVEPVLWEASTAHAKRQRRYDEAAAVDAMRSGAAHDDESRHPQVTQLDPDAASRQERRLAREDEEDERRLALTIFRFLRAGDPEGAQNACRVAGQPWRAASLGGNRLWHDARLLGAVGAAGGNAHRLAWTRACYALSRDKSIPLHERAAYASLCGNLAATLAVCHGWYDRLWAYYASLVCALLDDVLLRAPAEHACDLDASQYQEVLASREAQPRDATEIFRALRSDLRVSGAAGDEEELSLNAFHQIQEEYILNPDPVALVELLASWLPGADDPLLEPRDGGRSASAAPPHMSPQLLRFAAHVVLFFYGRVPTSSADRPELCRALLHAYIAYLAENGDADLVALYVARLDDEQDRVRTYARFLRTIDDTERRLECLMAAERAGLAVARITEYVVQATASSVTGGGGGGGGDLTERALYAATDTESGYVRDALDDEQVEARVRSIEWLCFDPAQRTAALVECNTVLREFVAAHRIEPCRRLVRDVMPADTLTSVREVGENGCDDWHVRERAVREHLAMRAYLDALHAFDKWLAHHDGAAPTPPPTPPRQGTGDGGGDLAYSEEVKYERQRGAYERALHQWTEHDHRLANDADQKLHDVLTFPGGWLLDDDAAEERNATACGVSREELYRSYEEVDYERRQVQLDELRCMCVPSLVYLYHRLLSSTAQHGQAMLLADLIADEDLGLHKCFGVDEIERLLDLLRQSAIANLRDGKDAFGY